MGQKNENGAKKNFWSKSLNTGPKWHGWNVVFLLLKKEVEKQQFLTLISLILKPEFFLIFIFRVQIDSHITIS